MANPSIYTQPLHLGPGARATIQPPFTGIDWYEGYGARHDGDGLEGRLVSHHRFTSDWDSWEMHPLGDEAVICLTGGITLHQQMADGSSATVTLAPGDYAINPPGCWHTADIAGEASCLFITAGIGTEHRAR